MSEQCQYEKYVRYAAELTTEMFRQNLTREMVQKMEELNLEELRNAAAEHSEVILVLQKANPPISANALARFENAANEAFREFNEAWETYESAFQNSQPDPKSDGK